MRFIVHDYLIGILILTDCTAQTLTLYKMNDSGEIYNLRKPNCLAVDAKMKRELMQRTKGDYGPHNCKPADSYIFTYLLTPKEREKCIRKPRKPLGDIIVETDSFHEAIKKICGFAYDYEYGGEDRTIGDKALFLQYCDNFLQENPSPPTPALKERGIGAR